jgi:serine/threonine protein kinase/dipeptidyl aminopeptidase/acylaminoacyl peptidase
MTLVAGTRLGPYEILSPLGAGGMGEVYKARDTRLDRDVAIKVLPQSLARDPVALARFEREAKAVAALSHPNILAVHDFGSSGETTYAVMELLEGESLRQRLSDGALPTRKAAEIAREIALGLAAAHDKGIVHRDLKPENLFLTREGRVKILDFGLARQLGLAESGDTHSPTAAAGTEPGTVLGTVGYMAPEQLRGQPADHRSDIFSFGAVLYEMLAGRRAFHGETAIETMNAILKEDPPELSTSGKAIPPGLERIVSHCLEKKPDERFQSARDLAFDLGAQSTASVATGAAPTIPTPSRWRRRLAFSVVGLAGLAIAFWAGTRLGTGSGVQKIRFQRLTFRRGNVLSARFAPDGQTVVYSAAWEGKPSELFSVRTDSLESRPLGLDHADVLSVSSRGELAVLIGRGSLQRPGVPGTLARLPLGGGAARELQEDVLSAAWAPDGETLAIMRTASNGKNVLEFPIGHAIEESFFLVRRFTISRKGELAYVDFTDAGKFDLWVVDRGGKKRRLAEGLRSVDGISWSPRTGEIFFCGGRGAGDNAVRAVSLSGSERVIWPGAGNFALHDVAPDGRLLLERYTSRVGVAYVPGDGAPSRDLGWLDSTSLQDLSRDGSQILFAETGEGGGSSRGVYVRRTDGSPAVRLGDGRPMTFSPDGKWALTLAAGAKPEIVLMPTGPGSPRKVPIEGVQPLGAIFIGDGSRIAIFHSAPGEPPQVSIVGVEGGRPKPVRTEGVNVDAGVAFSPDAARIAYGVADRRIMITPISGGAAVSVPGAPLDGCEIISGWSRDGRSLILQNRCEIPGRLSRMDLQTGARTDWKEVQLGDPAGVIDVSDLHFTADGNGYAYSYTRAVSSDLYLVDGLK